MLPNSTFININAVVETIPGVSLHTLAPKASNLVNTMGIISAVGETRLTVINIITPDTNVLLATTREKEEGRAV
jgi:hypothetical protein